MSSTLDRAEQHLEKADSHVRAATVIARDRDSARRRPPRDMHRKAATATRAALNDLTRYYHHGATR